MFYGPNEFKHEYPKGFNPSSPDFDPADAAANPFGRPHKSIRELATEQRERYDMQVKEMELKEAFDAFKTQYGIVADELEQIRRAQTKSQADADDFAATVRERLSALGSGRRSEPETLGKVFTNSPEFQMWRKSKQPVTLNWEAPPIEFKSILNVTPPADFGGLVGFAHGPLTMRSVLPTIRTTSAGVEYLRATSKVVTGSIIQLTQGSTKASASWTYQPVAANIVTFAETAKSSMQCLEDIELLEQSISQELLAQVQQAEEFEILQGPGGAGHMEGFLLLAADFTGGVSGDTQVDVIMRAIAAQVAAGYPPDALILPPDGLLGMSLMKDTLERALFPNVASLPWSPSVRTVVSSQMPAGEFLLGSFRVYSTLLDRSQSIMTGYENDDFSKNLVTIRVDVRSGLVIKRPLAFLKGSLTPPVA